MIGPPKSRVLEKACAAKTIGDWIKTFRASWFPGLASRVGQAQDESAGVGDTGHRQTTKSNLRAPPTRKLGMAGSVSKVCHEAATEPAHPAVKVNAGRRGVSLTLFPDSHPRVAYLGGLTLNACCGGMSYIVLPQFEMGIVI